MDTHTHTPLHKHRGQERARCVAQETKLHSLQYPVMEKNPNTDMHACVTEPPGCTPGRYRLPCFSEGQASFFFFFLVEENNVTESNQYQANVPAHPPGWTCLCPLRLWSPPSRTPGGRPAGERDAQLEEGRLGVLRLPGDERWEDSGLYSVGPLPGVV